MGMQEMCGVQRGEELTYAGVTQINRGTVIGYEESLRTCGYRTAARRLPERRRCDSLADQDVRIHRALPLWRTGRTGQWRADVSRRRLDHGHERASVECEPGAARLRNPDADRVCRRCGRTLPKIAIGRREDCGGSQRDRLWRTAVRS